MVCNLLAQGVAKRYTMVKAKGDGNNFKKKMCFLLNKSICLRRLISSRLGKAFMSKPYTRFSSLYLPSK
jgi:hypothetical protein